jgi:hypothetical protein
MALSDALSQARALVKRRLPRERRERLHRLISGRRRAGLWRVRPVSRAAGYDRGKPVDRLYIERFLESRSSDIRGLVLEIGDCEYTKRFGRAVTSCEVLHAVPGNPAADLVGDLASGEGIPRDRYDCMILTDVLNSIFDLPAAVRHIHAALRPGGVALMTVPGLQPLYSWDSDRWGDYWRFEEQALTRLFGDVFGKDAITVGSHGNALVAAASIYGLAVEDMRPRHFEHDDPERPVTLTVRAVRAEA